MAMAGLHAKVLQHLHEWATQPVPDCELLRCFAQQRDEAAFTALVRRHGPMVYHVCRRALGNVDDAEDAVQATFLVLAANAGAGHWRVALAGWLHEAGQGQPNPMLMRLLAEWEQELKERQARRS